VKFLLAILRRLDCQHAHLGPPWLRGEHAWRTCLDCARPVASTLQEPLDAQGRPLIGRPVETAPVDRAAIAAQVRRDYEEQLALRGPLAAHRTGIERVTGAGQPDRAAAELERMVRL